MPLHCHIDGKQVHLNDDLEATITAAGGYETLTATCARDDVKHAHQGSHVSIETSAGFEVWFGTLDATPAISRLPVVHITATGPVARLRRARANYLGQDRSYDSWKAQDSDPYGYATTGRIQVDSQGGRLNFLLPNGTDIKQNNTNGLVAWYPGEPVTRMAFSWDGLAATTNMVLQIFAASGPSGTRTQVGADISLNATSGTVDRNIAVDGADLVNLVLDWTAADATTSATYRLRITNLRVNGRQSGDDVAPGLIIKDMASTVGLNTDDVDASGQNALPFYWEGGSWGDAVDSLALLDDWPWLIDRAGMHYGAWEERWDLKFSQENEDLDFPPLYNRARVFYTTLAGAPKQVLITASPDPLARFDEVNEYEFDLGQSYDGDNIPTAVGNVLLDRLSEQRVVGSITVTSIATNKRVWTPNRRFTVGSTEKIFHIRPGQLAHLEPYPRLPLQRIQQVTIHPRDVQVTFGEDVEQVSVARTLARLALGRARSRPKKRKKGK